MVYLLARGIIPYAVSFLGLFVISESPRWLAKMGRDAEFNAALRKLRGENTDISQEAAEIQDYIETLENLPKAKMVDLFERRYKRSVVRAFGLMVFQQFGGINGICFYAGSIFEQACFPRRHGMIMYAVIQGVAGGMATLVNWIGAWAVSYTFNFLMSWSSYGTFIIYAVINALAIVFVILVVPETKGKTLEQIQAIANP